MSIAAIQTRIAGSTGPVSSFAQTYASGPVQNDLLLAVANSDSTLTMVNSGWTLDVTLVYFTGLYMWRKIAGASEPSTVTVTPGSTTSVELALLEFSGIATSTPLDSGTAASGHSPSITNTYSFSTAAATSNANELVVVAFGMNENNLPNPTFTSFTAGWTGVGFAQGIGAAQANNTDLGVAYIVVSSTGVQTCTMTWSINEAQPQALIGSYIQSAISSQNIAPAGVDTSSATALTTAASLLRSP